MRRLSIVLIRHGQTGDNHNRLIQGQTDSKLSQFGREQSEVVGLHLKDEVFTRAYSSDLSRAHETAEIILKQNKKVSKPELILDKRLRERCYGVMEGQPAAKMKEEAIRRGIKHGEWIPEKAESIEQITERIMSFFQSMFDIGKTGNSNENILVVTHGGWLKVLILHLSSKPDQFLLTNFDDSRKETICGNTGITRLELCPVKNNKPRNIIFSSFYNVDHLTTTGKHSIYADGV